MNGGLDGWEKIEGAHAHFPLCQNSNDDVNRSENRFGILTKSIESKKPTENLPQN